MPSTGSEKAKLFYGLQLIAEITPDERDQIEDAIAAVFCKNHHADSGRCPIQMQASTAHHDIALVYRWIGVEE